MGRGKVLVMTFVVLISVFIGSLSVFGQTFTNSGGDQDWNNAANWSTGTVPGVGTTPQIIPMPPVLGFTVNVVDEPPQTGAITLEASTLIVDGILRPDGTSPPALNAFSVSGVSISGLLETPGKIMFDDSVLQLFGGTMRATGAVDSEINFVNSTIQRDNASILETPKLVLNSTDLDLLNADQIDDELEVSFGAMANISGTQNSPNLAISILESSELIVGADLIAKSILVDDGSTLRLNSGAISCDELTLQRSAGALETQVIQDGGSFDTSDLVASGSGISISIGENDQVTNQITASRVAQVEILKPLSLDIVSVDGFGRVIYKQPAGTIEGLELQQFFPLFGFLELEFNQDAYDGLVWGLRVAGDRTATAQDWINSGSITSTSPLTVVYDFANLGDFTYFGVLRTTTTTTLSGGVLSIVGTDLNDNILVEAGASAGEAILTSNGGLPVSYSGVTSVLIMGDKGDDTIVVDSLAAEIFGGDDNDNITVLGTLAATIFGGSGDDMITGGDGDDQIEGGLGNDNIAGGIGNDIIMAGGTGITDTSMNTIDGGTGNDMLMGDEGDDTIEGANGEDMIFGYGGIDNLSGSGGDDCVMGGDANDFCSGGTGNDLIDGEDGADDIQGGGNDDMLYGGEGNDVINGFDGRDRLEGGNGDDDLFGGKQRDIIIGGNGNDLVSGQGGNDVVRGGNDNDEVIGGAGKDGLFGDNGMDVLSGNGGDDTFMGGGGDDQFFGGAGFDTALDVAELGQSGIEN